MKTKLFPSLLVFFTLILTLLNLIIFYLFTPGLLLETKTIIIKPKLSNYEITKKLHKNGIISYPQIFWALSKCFIFKNLKFGEYSFTSKITPYQVFNILFSGKSIIHKLIIPEGITVNEIINIVNNENLLFGEITETTTEGFLMPSTYFFSYGDQKQQLINQMRHDMSKVLDSVMLKISLNSIINTRLGVLILASIIEKETGFDEERPLIAAVFLNRLKIGMKLQADPTTIYALTDGKFKLTRRLTKKDLSIKSPYNTYYTYGLPPTAICCPGIKSLEAVVQPAKSDALYFVLNNSGKHSFSNNLKDHNINVNIYKNQLK